MQRPWTLIVLSWWLVGPQAKAWAEEGAVVGVDFPPDDGTIWGLPGGEGEGICEGPLYETVIRAPRLRWTASEFRLEGAALAAAPRRSTEDLLRLAPGLLVVQHGAEGKGHQIFLRGFDAAHGTDVEVLVDGLPINMLSNVHGHGYLDLNFIPPELVQSLDVLRGSFDVGQGDLATAGSVHFDLGVAPEARGTRLSYQRGLTNRHRLLALHAPRGGGETFVASEFVHDDGFGADRWTRRASVMGRLEGSRMFRTADVDLLVGLYGADFGSPNAVRSHDAEQGSLGFLDTYTPGLEGRTARAVLLARSTIERGGHEVTLRAGSMATRFAIESNYTGYLEDEELGDFRRQRHDVVEGFLSGWWRHRCRLADRPLRLRAGLEWRGDWFQQDEALVEMPSRQAWRTDRDALAHTHRLTAALAARWAVSSWFHAEIGARYDVFMIRFRDLLEEQDYGEELHALSPRVRLRLPLREEWTLFASYGRGLRSPEARAVAVVDQPHEDVELDRYQGGRPRITLSDALELGARFSWQQRVSLTFTGFGVFIERESTFDHVCGTNLELSGSRRLGAELGLELQPWSWLQLRGDVTAVHARFVSSGRAIPGAPWLLSSFGLTAVHPIGLSGSLTGFYMAPRPLAHGAVGSHQLIVNAALAYRWRCLEARVELENLTNTQWREGEYHFASWFDRSGTRSLIPVTHYTAGPPFGARFSLTLWL
jgi:outer membrane receptor protein involved in Fe transport